MAIQVEGYDDIEEVARGGFGVVYKARHVRFDRVVALKVLSQLHADDDASRRWERECRAMGALSWHPNIVVVYDLGVTGDDHPFLSMEFLDRGSLADRIVHQGPLPWPEAVDLTVQVAGALQAAHDAGVLHRDIKPENILVGLYGEAKLADFGLATGDNHTGQTAAGLASFTIAHASPEALSGERLSAAADVYSLGSTLYHLLAGRPPFVTSGDANLVAAVQRVISDPPPDLRPAGVPDQVALVVETAMAKDPTARYATAADLGRSLQAAQQELGVAVSDLRLDPRGVEATPLPVVSPGTGSGDASGETVTVDPTTRPVPGREEGPEGAPGEASGVTVRGASAGMVASPPGQPPVPAAPPVIPPLPPPTAPTAAPHPAAPPDPAPAPEAADSAATPGAVPDRANGKRSKLPLVLGLVAVVALLAVAAAVLLGGGGGGDGGDDDAGGGGGGAAAVEDGEVGAVVATIRVGTTPRGVAVDAAAAWVANRGDATVSRVDTAENEVTDTVEVGEGPRDVAVGLGAVWVTSLEAQEVARLDPDDATVQEAVAFDGGPQSVTTAAGLVWVTDRRDSTVVSLDPDTLEPVDEIEVGADPAAVVADGDDFLWVTNRADGTLSKVDLGERAVVDTVDVGERPAEAAVDGDSVWLASEGTSSLLRIDKDSGEVVDTIDIGLRVGGTAIDDAGNVWVDGLSTLLMVDPDTAEVVGEVDVGGELREVAAGAGSIWTVPHDGVVLTRVDPG